MMTLLGDIYIEQGKAPKAVYIFRELISKRSKDKRVCEWQFYIVQAMLTAGTKKQKVDSIRDLVRLYTGVRKKKILPAEQLSECRDSAMNTTSELALLWHNEANKTKNFETLSHVDRLYKLYITNFQDAKDIGRMEYYYAELMWQRAESETKPRLATELWERSAVAFTDVVKSGKVSGKLLKESAYASVLAWKNALRVDPRTDVAPPDTETTVSAIPKKKPIPKRQQKMLEAFDVYITYVKDPEDEELVSMKFLKARLYWRYNHFDKATPMFEDLATNHLDHETGEWSVNILLHTYNQTQQYDKLVATAKRLKKRKQWLAEHDEVEGRLDTILAQAQRKAAEKLEKDAEESGDYGKYVACGKAYVDIYNSNPEAPKSDEVLYNAGVCFEKGRSIGAAISMFSILRSRHPNSNSARRAIGRLGANFGRVAFYEKAAKYLEEYAAKYGGEKDADKALSNAIFYRKGIGDDDKAIKDTKAFIAKKSTKRGKKAEAHFNIHYIYEKRGENDKLVRHLQEYLKDYRKSGGVDKEIIAQAKIGLALWKKSCPVKAVNGTCIKVRRARSLASRKRKRRRGSSLPTQCGPESKLKVTNVDRDRRLVSRAQRAFKAALKAYGGGKASRRVSGSKEEKAGRLRLMNKYAAAAQFHLAEADYERFLRIEFPKGMDFNPKKPKLAKKSLKRFGDYRKNKMSKMQKTGEAYKKIASGKDPHWAIASSSRIAQLSQNFSDQMFTAEIPKFVRTGKFAEDGVDAYCDKLAEVTEPLEKLSINEFGRCLGTATKLSWYNDWSKLCEKELGQIRPEQFPTASEVRVSPNLIAPVLSTESPVLVLEGE